MVALVVTIIILLILAGIVITLAVGENGIITRSKQVAEIYKMSEESEQRQMDSLYNEIIVNNDSELENLSLKLENLEKEIDIQKKEIIILIFQLQLSHQLALIDQL